MILASISLLHIYWGLGGCWPAKNREGLAQIVLGGPPGTKVPGPAACFAVAAALLLTPARLLGPILLARGLAGYAERWFRPSMLNSPYARLSLWLYSPLCLALGWGLALTREATTSLSARPLRASLL